jgi:hypothetical protein
VRERKLQPIDRLGRGALGDGATNGRGFTGHWEFLIRDPMAEPVGSVGFCRVMSGLS